MTNLRFRAPLAPPPGGAVPLRLGADYEGDPPIATPVIGGTVQALTIAAWGSATRAAATVRAAWRAGSAVVRGAAAPWRAGMPVAPAWAKAPWRAAVAVSGVLVGASASAALPVAGLVSLPARDAGHVEALGAVRWRSALAQHRSIRAPWGTGTHQHRSTRAPWVAGVLAHVAAGAPFGLARGAVTPTGMPWRTAAGVHSEGGPWAIPVVPVPPGPVPCYTPPAGTAVHLRFADWARGHTALRFACARAVALVRVPIREVYMISNTTSLVRVSDSISVPVRSLSLALDVDSWAWSFSAQLPWDAMALVEPGVDGAPVELQATVNGIAVRLAVEVIGRDRQFNQVGIRISGRGISAALADPYQPVTPFGNAGGALTAQQLLDQALPSGWTADWGLTAWLVPAGVWAHQGTPMSAAVAIAAAGGGYVQPHNTARQLRILPRYPSAPWTWAAATPDLELPAAVTQREAIEWVQRPRYNRVYVSGTSAGVLGRVTRAGTAGDVLAPMVTDALTTHVDAARQRGLAILGDTGRQARVTLRLPVLAETGIIVPGRLVRYVDGGTTRVGLSRSVAVDAGPGATWQTVGVETHVE